MNMDFFESEWNISCGVIKKNILTKVVCANIYIYIRKIVFELFHVTNGISFVLSYVMLPVEIFVKTFSRSTREGEGTPT